jgi:SAM-dependent methyltransferase
MNEPAVTKDWLVSQIHEMGPWHHDIQITQDLSTGQVVADEGRSGCSGNNGVSMISPRNLFFERVSALYPGGLSGRRFLDCACNAGAYCFFARELDAETSVGFDVRNHWIRQAKFVQRYRTVAPTDRIEFRELDLFDLPSQNLKLFDFTLFSGIFYHLPDPIYGLKLAADLTRDVILVNTATLDDANNPRGLTPRRRPVDEAGQKVMSGIYRVAWFPNGPEAVNEILRWLGFKDVKLVRRIQKEKNRGRIEVIAARDDGRLDHIDGEPLY